MPGWKDLRPYQRRMVRWAVEKPYVYLAAEPGLGKTAVVLKAMQMWRDRLGVRKVLVVAPLTVARDTWPTERRKWEFARGLRMSLVLGSRQERERALAVDADVYVINRENIPWLYRYFGKDEWPFDALVYDEASRLKSGRLRTPKTTRKDGSMGGRRLSAFAMLCRRRGHFKRVVLMSGTPAPQGLQDWWAPLFLMDGGQRLGKNREVFLRRFFVPIPRAHKWVPVAGAHEEIMGRIRDVVFFMKEEDYLDLPPLVVTDRRVELPPRARKIYKRLARDAILAEKNIEAANSAVLANKLLQFSSGHVYDSDGDPVRFHSEKLRALEELLEDLGGEPLLLFWMFQSDRDAILEMFPFARCYGDSETDYEDWNAGRIRLLLAHPASVAYGLNMQFGGHHMCWYGPTNNLEHYLQGIKRLHRSGQKSKTVFVHRIVAKGTFDEVALELLDRKKSGNDAMLEAIRVYADEIGC